MAQKTRAFVGVLALAIGLGIVHVAHDGTAAAQAQKQGSGVPRFEVDPNWPKPLPNNWTFGEFSGVAVDSRDHVWIDQRPRTLGDDEKYLTVNPPPGDCCRPGPAIMEFDAEGRARVTTIPRTFPDQRRCRCFRRRTSYSWPTATGTGA